MQIAFDQPGTDLALGQSHVAVATFVAQGVDAAATVDQADFCLSELLVQGTIYGDLAELAHRCPADRHG